MAFGGEKRNPYEFGYNNPHEDRVLKKGEMIIANSGEEYDLLEELGEGGMGKVFKIKNKRNEIEQALKVMHFDHRTDPTSIKRFRREIELLTKIKGPFIVDVIDIVELPVGAEDVLGLVTELVDGVGLDEEIKFDYEKSEQCTIKPERAIRFISEVLLGLETLRKSGVVHRDLKPSNIYIEQMRAKDEEIKVLDKDGKPKVDENGKEVTKTVKGKIIGEVAKIGDFGIAKFSEDQTQSTSADRAQFSDEANLEVTNPGALMGSPAFMSPESIEGHPITHSSDLYSVGLILYEALSGSHPFDTVGVADMLRKHVEEQPEPLILKGVKIPAWLDNIILKLLRKDPKERFETAVDVFLAIKEGVKKDYPELLKEIPFIWDIKKTDSADEQEEDARIAA